jgi:uroporphyrin-III C-methyltransferase/precorrin-2 dehydrogenase/sirohydrochlorin ferrochelatase
MGLARLGRLVDGLIGAGLPEATPAAVVSRGTLPDQEIVSGRLVDLPGLAVGVSGPALIVVGDVVSLAPLVRGALDEQPAVPGYAALSA